VVIVTTPEEVALGDVRRALTLFREREIPILGLVENMSHLVCEHCGARNAAFPASSLTQNGDPGVSNETLARIPLTPELYAAGDGGVPLVLQDRESEAKTALLSLADRIAAALSRATSVVGLGAASAAPHPSRPPRSASRGAGVGDCAPRHQRLTTIEDAIRLPFIG
jgi:MinD-like ATPase involved in chromosome partitioning or flagellar assembly